MRSLPNTASRCSSPSPRPGISTASRSTRAPVRTGWPRGCAGWTSTPPTLRRIVCSHAHFDHTTALDVLLRVPGPVGLPVLIHPHFWRRRGAVCPGRELPTASPPASSGVSLSVQCVGEGSGPGR